MNAPATPLAIDLLDEEHFESNSTHTDAELDELNQLEGMDDEVDALDALLSESMALTAQARAAREHEKMLRISREDARKRLAKGQGTTLEKAMDAALINRVAEALGEWKAVANVGVFHRYNCACGTHHTLFEGIMVKQVGKEKGTSRMAQTLARRPGLPDIVYMREQRVQACDTCASAMGWDLNNANSWDI